MSDQYGPHSSGARRLHIGSHPMTETTCDGPQCWCNGGSVPYITTDEELAAYWAGKLKPCDPLLYTQAQVDALVKAESERRVGDITELRKSVERSVARRCEYLVRYRGHLVAAADIRREFGLTDDAHLPHSRLPVRRVQARAYAVLS